MTTRTHGGRLLVATVVATSVGLGLATGTGALVGPVAAEFGVTRGTVAVMLAALGVFGTGSGLPDLLVATIMGLLGLSAAYSVITHARREMRDRRGGPVAGARGP